MPEIDDVLVLRDFAHILEKLDLVEDVTDVIRRPYRYEEYFQIWTEFNCPNEEDDEWDGFVEAINSSEEEE